MPRSKTRKRKVEDLEEEEERYFLKPEAVSCHLYCSICQDVFTDPQRAPCGHSFCRKCILPWLKNSKTCPEDRKPVQSNQLHHDFILENIIGDQMVSTLFPGKTSIKWRCGQRQCLINTVYKRTEPKPDIGRQVQFPIYINRHHHQNHSKHRMLRHADDRLFTFPSKKSRSAEREKWKQLVGRSNGAKLWSPPKDSRVCSKHFVEGEPTMQNPRPTLDMGYDGAEKRVKRMANFEATQHVHRKKRRTVTKTPEDIQEATPIFEDPPEELLPKCKSELPWFVSWIVLMLGLYKELCEHKKKISTLTAQVRNLKQANLKLKETLYYDRILKTNDDVKFFTGLPTKNIFNILHERIAPYVVRRWTGAVAALKRVRTVLKGHKFGPQRKMTSKSEFLLMFMKLRLGLLNKDLAKRFDISETLVSRIFFTWLRATFVCLESLNFMPSPEQLIGSKPERFRKLGDLHSIIDCTELFIETPKDLFLQSASWSDYKHHNTLKLLIACAPNSLIIYVSPANLGRVSDKALTLACGFLDLVPRDSMIMADKGFNISNECAERHLSLYVPPGKRGQSQMQGPSVRKTMTIANHRILIEQVIRQLKTYRILSTELPISLIDHVDEIVGVCAALCNLKEPIYKT